MDQPEFELQLKVWKELAVSKQILMRAATDALGLDPECSSEELKEALAAAVEKTRAAQTEAKRTKEEAKATKAALEKKTAECDQALTALREAEQRVTAGREANAAALKKATSQLADKQRALKAINVALADTPENVVKKLKTLKKEKFDEATARKKAEADASSLRKEKQGLQQRLTEAETSLESGRELAERYRDLHGLCTELHGRIAASTADEGEETELVVPDLDEELLGKLEEEVESEEAR